MIGTRITQRKTMRLRLAFTLLCLLSFEPPAGFAAGVPLHFYRGYETLLHQVLDQKGAPRRVALRAREPQLTQVLDHFETFPPALFSAWKSKDQAAFYINVYNAQVLQILALAPRAAPESFPLLEGKSTLSGLEKKLSEPPFEEPRACLALISTGNQGPSLRVRPYYGAQLDSLLEEQSWIFFKTADHFRIDRSQNIVFLSPLLEKHEKGFLKLYGQTDHFSFLDPPQRAVLNFVSQHVKSKDRDYLMKAPVFSLRYLNEASN
jgi:hypothetical protein